MIRGTTPTFTFTLPFEADGLITDLRVTFAQGDETVLEKSIADCTLDGAKIGLNLTQEETLKFNHEKTIKIQVKVKFSDGSVAAAKPCFVFCREILNEEVL